MRRKCAAAAIALVTVLGAAACAEESDDAAGDKPDKTAKATTAKTETATTTERKIDTGRMSEGEFESATDALAEIDRELTEYAEMLSERCSLMIGAGEVSETLDCIDEAFEGVEKHIEIGYSTFDSLRSDVAKACLRNVTKMRNLLNIPLYRAAINSKEAMSSLDTARMSSTTQAFAKQRTTFSKQSIRLLAACAPK